MRTPLFSLYKLFPDMAGEVLAAGIARDLAAVERVLCSASLICGRLPIAGAEPFRRSLRLENTDVELVVFETTLTPTPRLMVSVIESRSKETGELIFKLSQARRLAIETLIGSGFVAVLPKGKIMVTTGTQANVYAFLKEEPLSPDWKSIYVGGFAGTTGDQLVTIPSTEKAEQEFIRKCEAQLTTKEQ